MNNPIDLTKVCEVGDTLYTINKNGIIEVVIARIEKDAVFNHYVYIYNIFQYNNYDDSAKCCIKSGFFYSHNVGKNYFKTKEEAQQKLEEREKIKKKRELLKEYEQKLNNELKIENHYFIK